MHFSRLSNRVNGVLGEVVFWGGGRRLGPDVGVFPNILTPSHHLVMGGVRVCGLAPLHDLRSWSRQGGIIR